MADVTFGSLFSGVGGFDLGFERAGMSCAWQVEKDEACQRVLAHHWPNVPRYTDVCEFPTGDVVRPRVICGGFPCQDLSVAGQRAGLAGKRSGLWHEFARVIEQFAPEWVCIENVPGLLSSNGGRDMGAIVGTLGNMGYGFAYRVLNAQWFGVPQRRRRVFIVGCLGDYRRPAEVLFERESLPWDSPPRSATRPRVAAGLTRGSGVGSNAPGRRREDDVNIVANAITNRIGKGINSNVSDPFVVGTLNSHAKRHGHTMTSQQAAESGHLIAHALTAEGHDASEDGTGRGTPLAVMERSTVRRLTPRECERLQGFPDDHTLIPGTSDSARYRQCGNAVAVPVAQWIGERLMQVTRDT